LDSAAVIALTTTQITNGRHMMSMSSTGHGVDPGHRRLFILSLIAVICMLGTFAGAAEAQLPPAVDMNIDNDVIPNQIESMGAAPEVPLAQCDAACSELRDAARATMPDAAGGEAVRREASTLLAHVGEFPVLKTLGEVALGASAFQIGWKIGTGIRTRWLGVEAPAVDPVTGVYSHYENFKLEPCDYSDSDWMRNGVSGHGYSYCGVGYTVYAPTKPMFASVERSKMTAEARMPTPAPSIGGQTGRSVGGGSS
jgi:hypothetical protein